MGPGIEPGVAAAEFDDMRLLLQFEVVAVDVGDFKLATGRRT